MLQVKKFGSQILNLKSLGASKPNGLNRIAKIVLWSYDINNVESRIIAA